MSKYVSAIIKLPRQPVTDIGARTHQQARLQAILNSLRKRITIKAAQYMDKTVVIEDSVATGIRPRNNTMVHLRDIRLRAILKVNL